MVLTCTGWKGYYNLNWDNIVCRHFSVYILLLSNKRPQPTHRLSTGGRIWRGNILGKPHWECPVWKQADFAQVGMWTGGITLGWRPLQPGFDNRSTLWNPQLAPTTVGSPNYFIILTHMAPEISQLARIVAAVLPDSFQVAVYKYVGKKHQWKYLNLTELFLREDFTNILKIL